MNLLSVLSARRCEPCNKEKLSGHLFCRACYGALPPDLKTEAWGSMPRLENTYRDARKFLEEHRPASDTAKFHAHLDACSRCSQRPLNLCPEGGRLLRGAAENIAADRKRRSRPADSVAHPDS